MCAIVHNHASEAFCVVSSNLFIIVLSIHQQLLYSVRDFGCLPDFITGRVREWVMR